MIHTKINGMFAKGIRSRVNSQ